MKKLWFAVLLIALASFIAQAQEAAQQPREWVRFDSRVGQFTVLMPQMPAENIEIVQSTAGPSTSHLFTAKSNNTTFIVRWVDYDSKVKFGAEKELNSHRDNFIKGVKGTLVRSNNATIDGLQSLEFTAETNEMTYKSRVLIVGRRPYQLIVGTNKGVDDSANTTRFFESFKIKQPN